MSWIYFSASALPSALIGYTLIHRLLFQSVLLACVKNVLRATNNKMNSNIEMRTALNIDQSSGGLRTPVVCSNAYAISMSCFSFQGFEINDRPIGSPDTKPAGTVILG